MIIGTAIGVFCRIYLALFTYGTNDAAMWESSAELIRETGSQSLYMQRVAVRDPQGRIVHREIFNHPPFMIRVLSGLNTIGDATGMPVRSSLRLLDTAADVGTILLTALILRTMLGAIPLLPMFLVATAPSWIFITGFHANSDSLMVFFLILAVYLIEARGRSSWGALSFAFATGIKVVPIILIPALLLYLTTRRDRIRTMVILMVFWLVTALPWLIASPVAIVRNTLGYGSLSGHWGLGVILPTIPLIGTISAQYFNQAGRVPLLLALLAVARWMNRGEHRVALYHQFGLLLFLFHVLTPGFGIQYLAWLTPWIAGMQWRLVAIHVITSGVFTAAVYTFWSGGLPWYYGNSHATGTWRGTISVLGLLTWYSVLLTVGAYWHDLKARSNRFLLR